MKQVFIIIAALSIFTSCTRPDFEYPESKIWAHRVNDTTAAMEKSKHFDGLEVDIFYSGYQDKIFVGHDIEDTTNNLLLDDWFNYIRQPSQKYFWIDAKNLDNNNAEDISQKLLSIMNKHHMNDNIFVESPDVKALKTIKDAGLRVILWTENIVWNNIDTTTWIEHTKKTINKLHPDAISNEAEMFELLVRYFPEQNIHLWQTPASPNEENKKITCKLCSNESIKVVLVDYDEPIAY